MPTVTLNTTRAFAAEPTMTILDAALRSGVALEYSCRTGRCGACKAPVVAGETAVLRSEAESLSPAEVANGVILTCCRAAVGDVTLDVEPLDRLAGLEIRTMPSRIVAIDRLAPDILKVVLKTPPASPMRFLAGQYVDVLAAGIRRSYSLANAQRADGHLELLIKRYPGGVMSDHWFERAKPNDLLRIEGPFGSFFLRDHAPPDIVFLATGTGIAPIKALLEELGADLVRAARHRLAVFWGNRAADSFCWNPTVPGLNVNFHPLLSGADAGWNGKRGYVQDAALQRGIDPAQTVVYACGSSAMIESARNALLARGLPAKRFFSDAFVRSN